MPKRIHVEKHLSIEELERRYREASDGVKRSHYQIVWLLSQGKLTREVTEATGYKAEWIRRIAGRYNQLGEEGWGTGVTAILERRIGHYSVPSYGRS